MFKLVLLSCVLLFGAAFALRGHEWPEQHPWYNHDNCTYNAAKQCPQDDHDQHCHHPDYDHIHLCIGESTPLPGQCRQMTCVHYDGNVVLERGCPTITPRADCTLTEEDTSRPYPYCCPIEQCADSGEGGYEDY